jgi:CDP-diacylglycerol--serine O-phosphatidyltransferase
MGDLETLAYLVLAGMFCDFFDGFFARQFKIDSQLGIQLDSLSDLVTFGLTSSVVMLQLIESSSYVVNNSSSTYVKFVPFIAFLITVASSYRLAKFNVNSIDSNFNGLPTPANALLIVFIPFFIDYFEISALFQNIYLVVFIVLISSSLLVSNLNMFSFKLKNLSFKENKLIYLFLLV